VMSAWGAAYGQLADILIGAEARSTTRRPRRRRLARCAAVHRWSSAWRKAPRSPRSISPRWMRPDPRR
jgi:hypothetical protein